ncbi:MAG: 16S rRNA (cytosine(1402)-N(4))-methyltransferase RsmH [Oligoflexia bacterium]|nr:16S rRNA (cytosine(1402)-N(4))-methyltransferase RsmH [Oligoflexia bacterium]
MSVHVPILLSPILESLLEPFRALPAGAPTHWVVDCTLGGGGHTSAFLEAFAADPHLKQHKVVAFDQDRSAIDAAARRFEREIAEGRLVVHYSRFSGAKKYFQNFPVLGLLADLGFSSDQIEDPERGLSFQADGPLDMRLDPTRGVSAREYLQRVTERELEHVLREYGEERFAGRIARVIVESRRAGTLPKTSLELARMIRDAVPPNARHGRIHAATRSFQAIRIQVNQELEELDSLLNDVILGVKTGGRVAILSFHSLEDRRVKQAFKVPPWRGLTKKPVEADEEEIRVNPRSRSAKLRIAQKL